jgi:hypothetical protein
MTVSELTIIIEYKVDNDLTLPETAQHFNISVGQLRRLLHENNIIIPKRTRDYLPETGNKISQTRQRSKQIYLSQYNWTDEYDNFINTHTRDNSIGIKSYCESRGYNQRHLRNFIRDNDLHQPRGIPKRTEKWKQSISDSLIGKIANPKGSNGKLKGKKLTKEHRDNISSGLINSYYGIGITEWKALQDDKAMYYRDVWRVTKNQPIDTLPNYKKRGNAGIDGNYQLDHIYPISRGFMNGIPADVIGNISNLQMLDWYENRVKGNSLT